MPEQLGMSSKANDRFLWLGIYGACLTQGIPEYCETEMFEADCGPNEVILVQTANYGRMRFGRCVDRDYGHVGCQKDVLHLADKWCSGRRSCRIPVPNSAFKSTRPCPKDLKPYFEAEYTCEKVVIAEGQSCASSSFILPESLSGYISNFITMETDRGSADCPWMIQGKHGQKFNISLIDFGRTSPTMSNSAADGYDICYVYAVIRERSRSQGLTVCSGQERVRHVYTSDDHAVEIRVIGKDSDKNSEYFLLKYDVFGCADPDPLKNMWFQRDGEVLLVGCDSSGQRWRLICVNSEWQGTVGNCTGASYPVFGEFQWGNFLIPFEMTLVIVVAIAVGIGIVILSLGLVCKRSLTRRRRAGKPIKQKPVHPVLPQRAENPKRSSVVRNGGGGSEGSLPPPPPYLMDNDNSPLSENEYFYISEMPPPPSASPPANTPDLPPPPLTPPSPPKSNEETPFPLPPPPMAATIMVEPAEILAGKNKRKSPNFCDVRSGANIGKYRVVQEKTFVQDRNWKFPKDYKYTITSGPVSQDGRAQHYETTVDNGAFTETPKYFELERSPVPSCNGFYSPSHTVVADDRSNQWKSLNKPKEKRKRGGKSAKQKPSNHKTDKMGTV